MVVVVGGKEIFYCKTKDDDDNLTQLSEFREREMNNLKKATRSRHIKS